MRIGHGFDIHRLEQSGKPLVIGGVRIPFEQGVIAHSDGDVLLHALCDALLGAAALGDLGQHFPDNDPQYQSIDSRVLVQNTMQLLKANAFSVVNVDATVITEKPKLATFIPTMRENIAADIKIDISCVNVKATTHEKLDALGQGHALAAHVVVLIH